VPQPKPTPGTELNDGSSSSSNTTTTYNSVRPSGSRTEVGHVGKLNVVVLTEVFVVLVDKVFRDAGVAAGLVVFLDPNDRKKKKKPLSHYARAAETSFCLFQKQNK
jgi:hypothetical protein